MSDNSWYEKGEPPVGWHGECTYGTKAAWRECVMLPKSKIAVFSDNWQKIETIDDSFGFRKLKTERERAIEEMANIFCKVDYSSKEIAGKLYDAGYRKTTPD